MKRREFLKKAGLTAAASATFSPLMFANAQASRFVFDMVTSWPTSLDTIYGGAVNTARFLNDITGGDIEVNVYPAGAQVGGLEVYDAVSSGAFQMGHTASYYYIGKNPAHGFFTAVPFGFNAQQINAWFYQGNGLDLWNELNAQDNLIAFPAGNTGVQMGGWFRREINSPADLQGLTMRIPGLGGQVMSRVGVNVQNLPGGEIFLALETGVLDATEWVGPYDDEILGLNRAATYYYFPGWHEPGPTLGTYMNLDEYNALPEDLQNAVQVASARANLQMLADYDAKNGPALERLVAAGAQLRAFPNEVLSTLEQAMNEIHEQNASGNEFYVRVLEDFRAFRDTIREWHQVSEYAYQNYVYSGETQE
jgi:TRAP-type mannitol/chloroaromatic compound transport system substrate-binding protein